MTLIEQWGTTTVFVLDATGPAIDGRKLRDLVAEASTAGATLMVLPVERLGPAFFDLRTGVAGDMLQVGATYRMRLAIVGELPEPAASSNAFAALVRESNASAQHWFLPGAADVRARLERAGP